MHSWQSPGRYNDKGVGMDWSWNVLSLFSRAPPPHLERIKRVWATVSFTTNTNSISATRVLNALECGIVTALALEKHLFQVHGAGLLLQLQ